MEYEIENNHLRIKVNSKGAELKSIYSFSNEKEYMWQANPMYWAKTSPVLFPTIGKTYNEEYLYNGKKYKMSKHGFAREMEFELIEQTKDKIVLEISSTSETYKKYPFKFNFKISYSLVGNIVEVGYQIKNLDDKVMYFQVGAHPAFNVEPDETYIYYKDKQNLINSILTPSGFLTDMKEELKLEDSYQKLSFDLFKYDTLVLASQNIAEVSLCDKEKNKIVTIESLSPVMAIWTPKADAPFLCVEPWYGACDKDKYDRDISNREFINELKSQAVFDAKYKIIIN